MSELSNKDMKTQLDEKVKENLRLEKLIESLHSQIKELQEKLTESESLKSHFISNITNEIINPFASILGLSQNIMALGDNEMRKARSMADLIYMEAFQLDFDLKNIFMAAKIEAGEIDPEIVNVDIRKIIDSSIDQFKYEIGKKNIEFLNEFMIEAEDGAFYFRTDPEKFKLIISNFISNALKFSEENNKIFVRTKLDNGILVVSVVDSGPGIDKKKIQEIFDRFRQLDSTIHSLNRGYGLGLSVTNALADVLQGDIHVENAEPKGSIFTLNLPPGEFSSEDVSGDENELFFDDEEIL